MNQYCSVHPVEVDEVTPDYPLGVPGPKQIEELLARLLEILEHDGG